MGEGWLLEEVLLHKNESVRCHQNGTADLIQTLSQGLSTFRHPGSARHARMRVGHRHVADLGLFSGRGNSLISSYEGGGADCLLSWGKGIRPGAWGRSPGGKSCDNTGKDVVTGPWPPGPCTELQHTVFLREIPLMARLCSQSAHSGPLPFPCC